MSTTLREFVEEFDRLTMELFRRHGEVCAVYMIQTEEHVGIVPVPPHLDKDALLHVMRELLAEWGATRCVLADEAWMAVGDDTEKMRREVEEHLLVNESLDNFPGRVEVIFYSAECRDEGILHAERVITRDADGVPTLGDLTFRDPGGTSEGRLVGMLPGAASKRELH